MRFFSKLIGFLAALGGSAHAVTYKSIYLDDDQNVHIITSKGVDLRLTKAGKAEKVGLSPDRETAAWLLKNSWNAPDQSMPGASELIVYRQGAIRSIKCEPFIREYWFLMKGKLVAIDCGGLHFSGREYLYDVRTLKEIATFDQAIVPANKRPTWSITSDEFKAD